MIDAFEQTAVDELMLDIGRAARVAMASLATTSDEQRNAALQGGAAELRRRVDDVLQANAIDLAAAKDKGLGAAMLDRLQLDAERVAAIADGVAAVAELPDPVGRVLAEWERPNGLRIQRVSVPLGVIGIIFESRPNVTADASALCVKSGNAAILRGGSESFHSNRAIHECMRAGLESAGVSGNAIQIVPTTDRAAVGFMLSSMADLIDVVVPRGGRSLIQRVQDEARVPVIGHLEGICHVYVHTSADPRMACEVAVNAKMRRTGICGAAETILVDKAAVGVLPELIDAMSNAGCEIRGDADVLAIDDRVSAAEDADWQTEYLDAVISVRVVDDLDAAIRHIADYGSGHTESIIASDQAAADEFLRRVDSAIVMHNASTQFADGGEFGMGAEIGIATGRIHARGPVGAEQLTSFKYVVRGSGQTRP